MERGGSKLGHKKQKTLDKELLARDEAEKKDPQVKKARLEQEHSKKANFMSTWFTGAEASKSNRKRGRDDVDDVDPVCSTDHQPTNRPPRVQENDFSMQDVDISATDGADGAVLQETVVVEDLDHDKVPDFELFAGLEPYSRKQQRVHGGLYLLQESTLEVPLVGRWNASAKYCECLCCEKGKKITDKRSGQGCQGETGRRYRLAKEASTSKAAATCSHSERVPVPIQPLIACHTGKKTYNTAPPPKTVPSAGQAQTTTMSLPTAPQQAPLSSRESRIFHQALFNISGGKHWGTMQIIEAGRWDEQLESDDVKDAWCSWGFPCRPGAKWTRQFSRGGLQGMSGNISAVQFRVGMLDAECEGRRRPWLFVKVIGQGLFANSAEVRASNPTALVNAFCAEHSISTIPDPYIFIGFRSEAFRHFFASITPSFRNPGPKKPLKLNPGSQGERQLRNVKSLLGDAVENLFREISPDSPEDALAVLLDYPQFADKYKSVLAAHSLDRSAKNNSHSQALLDFPLVQNMVNSYQSTSLLMNKEKQREILSLFAPHYTVRVTMELFNCTEYQVKAARLHSRMWGGCVPKFKEKMVVHRLNKETAEHIEAFSVRDDNMQRTAFSVNKQPGVQRKMRRARLWRKYKSECKTLGLKNCSKSFFYLFMSDSVVKDMHSRSCCCGQCVEFGLESWAALRDVVKLYLPSGQQVDSFLARIDEQESFYKYEYRSLLLVSSTEASLCMTHALSRKEPELHSKCDHDHVVSDTRTAALPILLSEVCCSIDRLDLEDEDERKDVLRQVADVDAHLQRYIAHLLRKEWSTRTQPRMLSDLKRGEAYGIQDYAEKILPGKHIETQSERFAKSGISFFGCTWMLHWEDLSKEELLDVCGEDMANSFVSGDFIAFSTSLFCNDAKQDWIHSWHCMKACFELLQERVPSIHSVRMRSDGAGNFKCVAQVLAMINLSAITKIKVIEYSISEAGDGKNFTDSRFQKVKLDLGHSLDFNMGDGTTAEQLNQITEDSKQHHEGSSTINRAMSFERGVGASVPHLVSSAIPGISGYYHFTYHYDDNGVFTHLDVSSLIETLVLARRSLQKKLVKCGLPTEMPSAPFMRFSLLQSLVFQLLKQQLACSGEINTKKWTENG